MRMMEQNPEDASLEIIDKYLKINKIKEHKLNSFEKYHRVNEDFDLELFNKGVSMKSYYYFKKIVSSYCSITYTLQFKNNVNIKNDSQVAKYLGMSLSSWRKTKCELIELNLMKVINFEGKKYYKINPCYVGKERILTPHTYYAFRDDLIKNNMISKYQILWWDKYFLEEYNVKFGEGVYKYKDQIQQNSTQSIGITGLEVL